MCRLLKKLPCQGTHRKGVMKLPRCPHCKLIVSYDHIEKCIEKGIKGERIALKEGWLYDWKERPRKD